MKGTIDITSNSEWGTKIRLNLPLQKEQVAVVV